jgi:hypothetical protein
MAYPFHTQSPFLTVYPVSQDLLERHLVSRNILSTYVLPDLRFIIVGPLPYTRSALTARSETPDLFLVV